MSKNGFFGRGKEEEAVETAETVTNEMQPTEVSTEGAPVAEGTAADEKKWNLNDGTECTKSAFIREKFSVDNMGRKEIAEKFDIPYRTVYGATVNMENAAEPTTRGRGTTFSKIHVDTLDNLVVDKDGITYIAGVEQPEGTTVETKEVDRNEWIKRQIAAGVDRGKIAKMLDLSYGVIYNLTKEADGARQKYEVELSDGTKISRSEYIRKRVEEGISKADIAKELDVEYSVVWQATKKLKTTEEKFIEAVKNLEKFMDQVEAPDTLAAIIAQLNGVKIKAEEKDKVTEEVKEA